jgi:hypothetical protein
MRAAHKSPRIQSRFSAAFAPGTSYDSHTGRGARTCRIKSTCSQEDAVKELSLEEVLRIAGGVPVSAALDELTYRAPQEAAGEPIDYARLLNASLHPSEPT